MRWLNPGFAAFLILAPVQLAAQSGGLAALRDSLSRNSSIADLKTRAATLAKGSDTVDPDALMERGLVMLRLYQLTQENKAGDEARDLFEKAIERDPRNGWAHYGLGLALVGGPGVRVPSPGGLLDGFVLGQSLAEAIGRDPRSRAGRQFIKALELDPRLTDAAVELANVAVESRNKDALRESRDALKMLVDQGRTESDLLTAYARIESALGNVDAASAIAERAASGPDASGAALRASAEALLRQPGKADEGARVWLEGVRKSDESALEQYYADVEVIASDAEIATWKKADLQARRAWMDEFWKIRAATSGRTVGERLAEHYQRLATAQERYRRIGKRGAAPPGAFINEKFANDQLPFDDRGLIYVRHGEPAEVVRTSHSELRPNETWVYRTATGKTVLHHFIVLRDGADYRLTDDIFNAVDPNIIELPYEAISKLFSERGAHDARYNILAARFDQIRNQKWAASALGVLGQGDASAGMSGGMVTGLASIGSSRQILVQENRANAEEALATDTDRPHFENPLPFYYDVFTVKGSGRQTEVTAAIAIPGASLAAQAIPGGYMYSIGVSLIVIDTLTDAVTRKDSVYHFRSQNRLGADQHLRIHTQLAAVASRTTVHRLVLRDAGRTDTGQMYGGATTVPTYDGQALAVSDIVLAEPVSGTWHRGDAKLALVPPRQFFEGQQVRLFYEVYNIPANTPYRTELLVEPNAEENGFTKLKRLFGGNSGRVRVSFDGVASLDSNGNLQELRSVGTSMKPGRYRVQVRVTNLTTQEVATSEKQFVVIKRPD